MKRLFFLTLSLIGIGFRGYTQNVSGHFYGEDIFKFSSYSNYGSARTLGMGGAFTALGGDAASIFINPAGLGFYNKSEISISPVFRSINTDGNYLGEDQNRKASYFNFGQIGAVFSKAGGGGAKRRGTFGIGYNTLANFNNDYTLQGSNNRSSITDSFAEQANSRGVTPGQLDSEFDTDYGIAYTPTAMYYQAFLINPNGDKSYIASDLSLPVNQSINVSERGNLGQISLAYAVNLSDRTYIGGGVGIQTLNYNIINSHREDFPNGELFNWFTYSNELIVKGTGVNFNLGVIHKITEDFRMGFNLRTPTWMRVQEAFYSAVEINPKPNTIETDFKVIETAPSDFNYGMTSPLRIGLGGAYMLPNRLGVFTADAEYVSYGKMKIREKEIPINTGEQNGAIASVYRDVVNIKSGVEFRFGNARVRGGANYLADPIKNNGLDRSAFILSVGAGIRSARFFADASFSSTKFKTSYTPYILNNEEDYASGVVNNRIGVLSLTLGTFF
jgi:hypothetical protein